MRHSTLKLPAINIGILMHLVGRNGLPLAAACLGILAWSSWTPLLAFAPLFALLWAQASNRREAFAVSAAYYLGSSWGLLPGSMTFFGTSILVGMGFWLLGASVSVLVMTLSWRERRGAGLRFVIGIIITALPPFGILAWANPVTAAGLWFPGLKWLGLLLMVAVMGVVAEWSKQSKIVRVAAVIGSMSAAVVASVSFDTGRDMVSWQGLKTRFEQVSSLDFMASYSRIRYVEEALQHSKSKVVLLPESFGGFWTISSAREWQRLAQKQKRIFIVGADVETAGRLENAMIVVSAEGVSEIFFQRMPVPFSMWRPWNEQSYHADIFRSGVVNVGDTKAAMIVCYESYLVWPILFSMSKAPDIILVSGNAWWAVYSPLGQLQQSIADAWGRLFGVPIVAALNGAQK